jgi:hypothetical protein
MQLDKNMVLDLVRQHGGHQRIDQADTGGSGLPGI